MTDSEPARIDPPGYGLGIDLGTMWTTAAVCRSAGPHPSVPTLVHLGGDGDAIPTLVAISADGLVEIGEAARVSSPVDSRQVIRDFKRFVGDPSPLAPPNWTPERLIARLVDHVVGQVCAVQGLPPSRITLAVPTCWGEDNRRLIIDAVAARDLQVTLVSDVEAAAEQYAATRWEHDAGPIAVVDFGGGFFDAAVLRSVAVRSGGGTAGGAEARDAHSGTPETSGTESGGGEPGSAVAGCAGSRGTELGSGESRSTELGGVVSGGVRARRAESWSRVMLSGPPEGSDRIGGIDLDDLIVDHVCAAVPEVAPMASDLWDECASAKESLTAGSIARIQLGQAPGADPVALSRPEFEAMIHPVVEQTVALLERAIASAGITPDALSEVLLLGGSSRIPLVAQKVSAAMGRPVVAGPDTDALVAHGAALLAARLSSGKVGGPGDGVVSEGVPRTFQAPPAPPRRAGVLQRLRARSTAPRRTTTRLRQPGSAGTGRSRGARTAGRALRPSALRSSVLLRSSVPRSWLSRSAASRSAVWRSGASVSRTAVWRSGTSRASVSRSGVFRSSVSPSSVSPSSVSRSSVSRWIASVVAHGRPTEGWSTRSRPWSILLPAMLLGASLTAVAAVALAAVAGGTTSLAATPINRATAPVAGIVALVPPITAQVPTGGPSPVPVVSPRPSRTPAPVRAPRRSSRTAGSAVGGSSTAAPAPSSVPATTSVTPTAGARATGQPAPASATHGTPLPTHAAGVP